MKCYITNFPAIQKILRAEGLVKPLARICIEITQQHK